MNTNETFKVGIYLRLSRDDEREDESQSISNQRDYIMNYIIRNIEPQILNMMQCIF